MLIKGTIICRDGYAGRFTLPVMNRKSVILVFSFVGMKSQEVAVSDVRKEVRVVMEENVDELEEVVITGYGTTPSDAPTGPWPC
ncbi:MAG: carboxypeptidase-like regulatory domain-containing protein [Butyricimonas faecalis]